MPRRAQEATTIEGVRISHPDKVLYPEAGITKAALARWYAFVADRMLPHLADRPLTLVRCPDGREGDCFYQKHARGTLPASVRVLDIREARKTATYMAVRDVAGILALVQLGVLEFHVWGSRADRPGRPDRVVFDLDPDPGLPFARVVAAAHLVRERLEEAGLRSYPLATGGKGIHVVLPLERRHGFDEVRAFARDVARSLEAEEPEAYVAQASKARRKGRIFVDYLRNARGATAVCPWSTRARPGAPVATPISWEEVAHGLRPDRWTVGNLPRRLAALGRDPWAGYGNLRQRLTRRARSRFQGAR